MKNCPVCLSPRPENPWITGIIFALDGITPLAVAYRCVCGNNRDIWWRDASDAEREQARLAQQSLDAASEMMARG